MLILSVLFCINSYKLSIFHAWTLKFRMATQKMRQNKCKIFNFFSKILPLDIPHFILPLPVVGHQFLSLFHIYFHLC